MSEAVTQFLEMGGYAAYVWASYGLALILLAGALAWSRHSLKQRQRVFDELKRQRRGNG